MQKVQVPLENNSQDEIKMPPKEINRVHESLQDEIKVLSKEIVQVQENDEINLSFKKISQVQESFHSSITWIKPKRIRWKNFTQPEKLQSTKIISIKSKISNV